MKSASAVLSQLGFEFLRPGHQKGVAPSEAQVDQVDGFAAPLPRADHEPLCAAPSSPDSEAAAAPPLKRGRGRPKGSKNKPKNPPKADEVVAPAAAPVVINAQVYEDQAPRDMLEEALENDPEFERHYVIGVKSLKHGKIFPPPKTKGLDAPRTVILERPTPRNPIERKLVLLGNSVTHCYTTDTLGVIAVLNQLWQEQGGSPDGLIKATYAEVARRMLWVKPGNESYGRSKVKAEIDRLRRLHLIFTDTTLNEQGERIADDSVDITYLSDYKYHTNRKDPSKNHFTANIHKYIVEKVAMGKIASLPIKSLLELKVNESKPLLLRVDSLMAYKEAINISFLEFSDLASIEKDSYVVQRHSFALKLFQRVAQDLDKRLLTSGHELKVVLKDNPNVARMMLSFERGNLVVYQPKGCGFTGGCNVDQDDVEYLKRLMMEAVCDPGIDKLEGLYEVYARAYPQELIERAISVFKTDKPTGIRIESGGAYFSSILSRIVSENGYSWIR